MVTPTMVLKFYKIFCFFIALFLSSHVGAIDNPDSPDFVRQLEQNERPYLKKINSPGNGTRDTLLAYHHYKVFLDTELNRAYKLVMKNLPDEYKKDLKESQRNWLKYRDAEFELINNNWDRKKFGSSFAISRGQYTSNIIRSRVVQLYRYAQNY